MAIKSQKTVKVRGRRFIAGENSLSIKVSATLEFTKDGKRLYGLTLKGDGDNGKVLEAIMDGKIKGLEYCKERKIKAIAGSGPIYCLHIY